ncbi:MAG: hypothetical protein HYU66_11085 [Armatimonadetes bacterium]|nr:hypothetical protein [Armatimonadota bacterium]
MQDLEKRQAGQPAGAGSSQEELRHQRMATLTAEARRTASEEWELAAHLRAEGRDAEADWAEGEAVSKALRYLRQCRTGWGDVALGVFVGGGCLAVVLAVVGAVLRLAMMPR